MANTYRNVGLTSSNKVTPQSKPIPGREKEMIPNNAGGVVFDAGIWTQLERFLVIGTVGGTYYLNEKHHTMQNFDCLNECLKQDFRKAIGMIADVSYSGRAMKQDQALFALAVACSTGRTEVTRLALAKLNMVCRTASHLQMFVDFVSPRRSWGRALRNAVSNWYLSKGVSNAAFQMTKYQERNGWSHKDILRSAHPKVKDEKMQALFQWAVGKGYQDILEGTMVDAYEMLKKAKSTDDAIDLIKKFNAPWEIVPTQFRTDPGVWEAMLPGMGTTALIRNLGNMTRYGVFDKTVNVETAVDRLTNPDILSKARIHPLNVLIGSLTYQSGHGFKSDNTWMPHRDISYAFEKAFGLSFKYAPKTGKRIAICVDCSASMWWTKLLNDLLTPGTIAACMALAFREAEDDSIVLGFSSGMVDLSFVRPGVSLKSVDDGMKRISYGGTDCAAPMVWATRNEKMYDAFVIITDNETWAGNIQPVQALQQYRGESGIKDSKLAVVGMTATNMSIADPKDPNMLDVVGCSADLPSVLQSFIGKKDDKLDLEED